MIYFNNVALENIAPVKIEDIRVSPIIQSPVARDRALLAGAQFIRAHEGTRTVNITFSILEQNYATRQGYIEAVTAWALSDEPKPMELPYHTDKLLDVICTQLPEPSTRQWWEARLNLTFTAFDPYFYDKTEKSKACGTAFTVAGNAPPWMKIVNTFASTASTVSYSDGTDTMTFDEIPAGDMEIDLNRQTAAVDGDSIMGAYGITSHFLIPRVGTQTITGTGTVKWRERWQA